MIDLHPLELAKILWPTIYFYREERQVIESVWRNKETYVPAGNKLGKDYVAGRIALLFFLTRHPCRIVTTSAKDDHLRVLWGEIGQAIQDSTYPLDHRKGGPLVINVQDIRKVIRGDVCPISYITGLVAGHDHRAAMQGHHVADPGDGTPRTLFLCDESSSVHDDYYKMASTWFNRALIFGNTWPCENFFRRACDTDDGAADVPSPRADGTFLRKIIRICAEDSPNIRLALAQMRAGLPITYERLVPGVKGYEEYLEDRAIWDDHQLCVSHGARWYKGAEIKLFPSAWLAEAIKRWQPRPPISSSGDRMRGMSTTSNYMGSDPGEGIANSAWAIGDDSGCRKIVSMKTPNTNDVSYTTLELMAQYDIPPENVCMDRGGGGKQHADRINEILESRGVDQQIRTVAFGESLVLEPKRGLRMIEEKVDHREEHYAYKTRRSQMFGEAGALIDPAGRCYAMPPPNLGPEYKRLHHALKAIPKQYDGEGRLDLPPKRRKPGEETTKKKTLTEMVGGDGMGLDEADAFVLMIHAMLHKSKRATAGAVR